MNRPIVSVFLALSLDGFIAGPHGDLAWLDAYSTDNPIETGYDRLMSHADTLIMGRNTYEKLLSFDEWPYSGKQVVVLTHRPLSSRYGETAMAGSINDLLKQLWEKGSRHVYLDGGQAVRQGLMEGVVDELTLSWAPVILGEGIALFAGIQHQLELKIDGLRCLPSGLVQTIYRPVR